MNKILASSITESQQRGLDAVAELYGTKTSFTKGFKVSNGRKAIIFTVKVGPSQMLDSLAWPTVSSNIALMVYENFSFEDRKTYTTIAVEKLVDNKVKEKPLYFGLNSLANAMDQARIFTDFSEHLIRGEYVAIVENVNPKYKNAQTLPNLTGYMEKLIREHGKIMGYKRTEYGILTLKNGDKLYKYIGYLKFADQSVQRYSVTTSMDITNNVFEGFKLN
nr:hypothetical protein [Muricauda sp. UBA7809]